MSSNMSNFNSDFSNIISDNPIDIMEFEKEISKRITSMAQMTQNSRDIEDLIVEALKRRCNDRKNIIHAHLRLKNGATMETFTISWNELSDLTEMVASKGAANAIRQRLANFYVRIANLHHQIEQARHSLPLATIKEMGFDPLHHPNSILTTAYAKNEQNMREKHHQNHRALDQIMQTLFLDSEIHPQLTEHDLPALEMQVKHIAESGCAVNELRRLKIIEAMLEERRFNQLTQELMTLTK